MSFKSKNPLSERVLSMESRGVQALSEYHATFAYTDVIQ